MRDTRLGTPPPFTAPLEAVAPRPSPRHLLCRVFSGRFMCSMAGRLPSSPPLSAYPPLLWLPAPSSLPTQHAQRGPPRFFGGEAPPPAELPPPPPHPLAGHKERGGECLPNPPPRPPAPAPRPSPHTCCLSFPDSFFLRRLRPSPRVFAPRRPGPAMLCLSLSLFSPAPSYSSGSKPPLAGSLISKEAARA